MRGATAHRKSRSHVKKPNALQRKTDEEVNVTSKRSSRLNPHQFLQCEKKKLNSQYMGAEYFFANSSAEVGGSARR